ncbi:MAG: hypothetical protein IJJ01_02425 [Firmicutes bacterium]|nr:hypothetical protein [Bacillota bacterium]
MTIVGIIAIIVMGILCILCVVCIAVILGNRRQARVNSEAIRDIEKSLSSVGDSIKEQTGQLIEQLGQQQSNDYQERRLELLEEEVRRLSRFDEIDLPDDVEDVFNKPEEPEEIEELGDDVELEDLLRELNAVASEEQEALESSQPAPQLAPLQEQPAPQQTQQPAPQPVWTPVPDVQPVQQMAPPVQPVQQMVPDVQPVQQMAPPVQPVQQPVQQAEEVLGETRYHQGYNIGRSGRRYTAEELNLLIRE